MFLDFDDFDVRDRFDVILEKSEDLKSQLEVISLEKQQYLTEALVKAYIFHDAALDGMVVTLDEIQSVFGLEDEIPFVRSRILQEIKNHRKKIFDMIIHAKKVRLSNPIYRSAEINIENILAVHEQVFEGIPRKEHGKLRTVDPLHLAYFHDIVDPSKIKERLLLLCAKSKDMDFRTQHPINQASIFHFEFMKIFPFLEGSGKVGRLFMNSFLLQGGFEQAIIHQSERQRYYEALKISPEELRLVLLDSIEAGLDSRINLLKNVDFFKQKQRRVVRRVTPIVSMYA